MQKIFTQQTLSLTTLSLFVLTACGSEQTNLAPRVVQPLNITAANSTTTPASTDILLQSDITISSGASTLVTIPTDSRLDCTKASVTWSIISGTGISLATSNLCTITATAIVGFKGEVNIRGETTYNNQKFVFSARLRDPITAAGGTSCSRDILVGTDYNGVSKECHVTISWEKDVNSCLQKGGNYLASDQTYTKFKQDDGSFPCLKTIGNFDWKTCATKAGEQFKIDLSALTYTSPQASGAFNTATAAYVPNFCVGDNGLCDNGFIVSKQKFDLCPVN